jgi:hypothetical protein
MAAAWAARGAAGAARAARDAAGDAAGATAWAAARDAACLQVRKLSLEVVDGRRVAETEVVAALVVGEHLRVILEDLAIDQLADLLGRELPALKLERELRHGLRGGLAGFVVQPCKVGVGEGRLCGRSV